MQAWGRRNNVAWDELMARGVHLPALSVWTYFMCAVNTRLTLFWELSRVSQMYIPTAVTGVFVKIHSPIVSLLGLLIKIKSLLSLGFWIRIVGNGA